MGTKLSNQFNIKINNDLKFDDQKKQSKNSLQVDMSPHLKYRSTDLIEKTIRTPEEQVVYEGIPQNQTPDVLSVGNKFDSKI